MELLLNLAWLLLALPAYWLWCARRSTQKSSMQCVLSLACLLVVLFPVISATDDLQAMRTEMEESSTSKRTARQAASPDKSPLLGWDGLVAVVASSTNPFTETKECFVSTAAPVVVAATPDARLLGRAPPSSFLA
jgi:hypothetical protein